MASITKKTTKDGKTFYEFRYHPARGAQTFSTRWYPPDGWTSGEKIMRKARDEAALFERKCRDGEVKTKAQLKAEREEAERAAEEERRREEATYTVKRFGEEIFMPTKAITLREKTRSSYQSMLDLHVYPVIGDVKLPDVTGPMIDDLLIAFQKSGVSFRSVQYLRVILGMLFKMARKRKMIREDPMADIQDVKRRADEKPAEGPEAFSPDEIRRIFECLENEPLKWRCFVKLLAYTGIRRGEACGLKWSCVDFKAGTITIKETLNYTTEKGVYSDFTKNKKDRTIKVNAEVIALLKELQIAQSEKCISKYVFTQDSSAEPIHPDSPTRYFRNFGARYGIDHFHPHKLRHSHASIAISSGADIASVSENLGHSDIAVTLRVYTHSNEEAKARAMDIFAAALKDKPKTKEA